MDDSRLDIKAFLDKDEQKDLLRFLTAGSVDDGKSTLIGRLLFDSKKLYEDQLDALERDSKRMGNAGDHIDYALLLDGLKAEREQGITIDVAYRYFSTNNRKFIIADTPGHEQYTRNMITGGSTANLAIILVDARTGVITQTRRHTFLVSLLGIKHVVLAVNKMDLVDFSEERFNEIVGEYKKFIAPLGIPDVTCIPLSALDGDNVVEKSERTPWYNGTSLLDFLETVPIDNDHNLKDFRFPVQYVLRPNLDFRGFCGKVASGIIRKGDEVMALPSGKKSRVKSIVTYDGELDYAFPPQSVTLTLEDEIDVSRGEMLVHPDNLPMMERNFEAMVVWMDEEPMDVNKSFFIKQTTNLSRTRIDNIKYKVDVNTMEKLSLDNGRLTKETLPMQLNQIARVVLTTAKELFFDPYQTNKATGSFILIDPITNNTSAVGMIIDRVEDKDMHVSEELPVLDLPKLGIAPEHYEAVEKAVKELERQGVAVIIKFRLTKAVCRMLSTLAPLQDKRYEKLLADKPLEHDPVFILGHWRSGTTFVHNVFSCDKHFGYNTTYQTVFPHLMMWGQPFFKKNMSWLMPDKRPTDNMELAVDLPQEEEFALANMMPYTYYNFWFLPKHQQEYADKYLLFDDISEAELKVFEETFTRLIKISLWNTHGTQFLSKNPPHTGRVKELVKMFPNAKFIYLMRNPYTVFESTRSFFTNTIQPLKLQDITPAELEQNILSIYAKLYHKYEADKASIPAGNLIEVKFEDFEADAMGMTEHIYDALSIPGFADARTAIEQYVGGKKGYKKNKYKYDDRTVQLVQDNWGFALKQWNYEL